MKKIKSMSKRLLAVLISVLILASMIPMSMFMTFAAGGDCDIYIKVVDTSLNGGEEPPQSTVKYKIKSPSLPGFYSATYKGNGEYYLERASQELEALVLDTTNPDDEDYVEISYNIETPDYDLSYGTFIVRPGQNNNYEIDIAMVEEPDLEFSVSEYNTLPYISAYSSTPKTFDLSAVTNADNVSPVKYRSLDPSVADIDDNGIVTIGNKTGDVVIEAWVEINEKYDEKKITQTIRVEKDTIAPEITDIVLETTIDKGDYTVSNEQITVKITAVDEQTAIEGYEYKLETDATAVEITDSSFKIDPLYRGSVMIRAKDIAGNYSDWKNADNKIIVVDNQYPVFDSISYIIDGNQHLNGTTIYTNGNIEVKFKLIENNMDISDAPQVVLNGNAVALTSWDKTTGEGSFVITEEGKHEFTISYEDIAGNSESTTVTDAVAIDRTGPVINAVNGNPTNWVNTDVTLVVDAVDADCGVIDTYSMNGLIQNDASFVVEQNGTYTFVVTDILGNSSQITVDVTKIDKVAPSIDELVSDQMDANGTIYWVNPDLTADANDVTIEGVVSDNASGVVSIWCKEGNGAFEEITAQAFDALTSTFADGAKTEECNTEYTYYCKDAAGNESSQKTIQVLIDKTKPQMVGTISEKTNKDITVTGAVSDNGTVITAGSGLDKVFYRLIGDAEWLEDATVSGVNFSFTTKLTGKASGIYNYEAYFVDKAGNASDIYTDTISVEFDETAPTVTIDSVTPIDTADTESWTNEEIVINGTVADDYLDFARNVKSLWVVRYNGNTEVSSEVLTFDAEGKFVYTIPNDANNNDTYKFRCEDNFTNKSVDSADSEVVARIDVGNPSKPTITYKTTAIQKFLRAITFGIYKAKSTEVVFEAEDDFSGVKEFTVKISGTEKILAATLVDGKYKAEYTIPEGTKSKLEVIAYDKAGNSSAEVADKGKDDKGNEIEVVVVDETAPVIESIIASPNTWTNQNVTISGEVSDNIGVVEVQIKKAGDASFTTIDEVIDDSIITEFSYNVPAQSYKGEYIVKCIDFAGNETEKAVEVEMDNIEPQIGLDYELEYYDADADDWKSLNRGEWTNAKIRIKGIATDNLSGIKEIAIKKATDTDFALIADVTIASDGNATFTYEIGAQNYEGTYVIKCVDNAGNVSDELNAGVKMDITDPIVDDADVKFYINDGSDWVELTAPYTNKDVQIRITPEDSAANGVVSGIKSVYIREDVDGIFWSEVAYDEDLAAYVCVINAADVADQAYQICCYDNAGNDSDVLPIDVPIDNVAPQVSDDYELEFYDAENDSWKALAKDEWINAKIRIKGTATDDRSGISEVLIKKADDADFVAVDDVVVDADGNATFTYEIDAQNYEGDYIIKCADVATNVSDEKNVGVKMDKDIPVIDAAYELEYFDAQSAEWKPLEKGVWINAKIRIKGNATDNLSGINEILIKKADDANLVAIDDIEIDTDGNATFTYEIDAQNYEGDYIIACTDKAGNASAEVIVGVKMDIVAPVVESDNVKFYIKDQDGNWTELTASYTNRDVRVVIAAEDSVADGVSSGILTLEIKENGKEWTQAEFDDELNAYTYVVSSGDMDYNEYQIRCADKAGNVSDILDIDVPIDNAPPVVVVPVLANPSTWTNDKVVISGTVDDDASGVVNVYVSNNPTDETSWKEATLDGKNYTYEIPEDFEGESKFYVTCIDAAGNQFEDEATVDVYVDKSAPIGLDIKYDVKEDPSNWFEIVIDTVKGWFGFNDNADGQEKITATLTAIDTLSGIDKFEYSIKADENKNDIKVEILKDDLTFEEVDMVVDETTGTTVKVNQAKYAFEIDPQYRGNVKFWAYDAAVADDGESNITEYIDDKTIVVDTIAPQAEIDYDFEYKEDGTKIYAQNKEGNDVKVAFTITEANFDLAVAPVIKNNNAEIAATWEKIDADNDKWQTVVTLTEEGKHQLTLEFTDRSGNKVGECKTKEIIIDKTAPVGSITPVGLTYVGIGNKAEVTIKIDETNFSSGDVFVQMKNEKATDKSWQSKTADVVWNGNEGKIVIDQAGEYQVKVNYTDKSGNVMTECVTGEIIIDYTAPKIDVVYNIDTGIEDGRLYINDKRVATVTIVEEYFNDEDVNFAATVTAKDITEKDINTGVNYSALGKTVTEWTKVEDQDYTYTMDIVFDTEANYEFAIKYSDLASNTVNYNAPSFTFDNSVPYDLGATYVVEDNWYDDILEFFTFGFYNAQTEVTITAYDDVAGIKEFNYSYISDAKASKVNASLENVVIKSEDITFSGNKATATFMLPNSELNENNQFNGTIKFTVTDRAGKQSEYTAEKQIIVVDNIKPVSSVTFNDPTNTLSGVSYYDGDIEAKVVINEANFYSEDVQIVVTKDGAPYQLTNVKWTHDSTDVHVGTFTLTEDGDYVVKVDYTDKSKNVMDTFESNQLTIDTVEPEIKVSDITHGSANNNETIGLTITITDINIEAENIKPVLNAVIQKDAGENTYTYQTISIPLGDPTPIYNANNEIIGYTYTVTNFETDGYYTLSCTVVDNANHKVSTLGAKGGSGGNVDVNTFNYSVNRQGSVFWIETTHTNAKGDVFENELNGKYVNGSITVKLFERNVDTVDVNADKRTVLTLNDGTNTEDVVLVENDNYIKNAVVASGGWYETVYTLDDDNFDHDGVYSINIITHDRANNSNVNTKTEKGIITFTRDHTLPVIASNVKNGQTINAANFDVKFEITEANLDPETVKFVLVEPKRIGKATKETVVDAVSLGNNEYKVNIGQGLNYAIKITASDLATNESKEYVVEDLTISTNIFVRWYANTALFIGSIVAVAAATLFIIIFIAVKKRKKDQ